MTFQKLFITNLKFLRKSRNVSQAELAKICASSHAYIAEIEAGEIFPSLDMIEKIASALEIEPYCLFLNNVETDISILMPVQKQEIINMLYKAAVKIINDY